MVKFEKQKKSSVFFSKTICFPFKFFFDWDFGGFTTLFILSDALWVFCENFIFLPQSDLMRNCGFVMSLVKITRPKVRKA